jgi:hypothetical protein
MKRSDIYIGADGQQYGCTYCTEAWRFGAIQSAFPVSDDWDGHQYHGYARLTVGWARELDYPPPRPRTDKEARAYKAWVEIDALAREAETLCKEGVDLTATVQECSRTWDKARFTAIVPELRDYKSRYQEWVSAKHPLLWAAAGYRPHEEVPHSRGELSFDPTWWTHAPIASYNEVIGIEELANSLRIALDRGKWSPLRRRKFLRAKARAAERAARAARTAGSVPAGGASPPEELMPPEWEEVEVTA